MSKFMWLLFKELSKIKGKMQFSPALGIGMGYGIE